MQHPEHENLYLVDPACSHNINATCLDIVLNVAMQNMTSGAHYTWLVSPCTCASEPSHENMPNKRDAFSNNHFNVDSMLSVLQIFNPGRTGFRVCEVGAGSGGLTRDAFPILDMDGNVEILQYTATDISRGWASRLLDSVKSPKMQFKARAICLGLRAFFH